jgi:hypothetical protein
MPIFGNYKKKISLGVIYILEKEFQLTPHMDPHVGLRYILHIIHSPTSPNSGWH